MKIKLIEPLTIEESLLTKLAKPLEQLGHEFVYYDTISKDLEEMKVRVEDAEILIIANTPLPKEVIECATKLKMVAVAFTGIDHVDKETIQERKIILCNASGYSNNAVAELTIGLTLDLLRNISTCNTVIRNGGTIAGLIGSELQSKTIGIVGTGKIGCQVAKLYQAFGCNLIGFDPYPSEAGKALGIKYTTIDNVMKEADIVTLHLPLTVDTKGFISKDKLMLMKDSAFLINCARGPIVDNNALAEMLNNNKIQGAGIDVFDMEPPIPNDYPLLQAKNTILTPHVAFASKQSMIKRAEITFDNIHNYLKGTPINKML